MSTDWNVHCVDCKDTLHFDDANHQDEFMARLCKNAEAIAALAPLIVGDYTAELRTPWGNVDIRWFAKHRGHRLVPISEYGYFMDQCSEYVVCTCGSNRRCTKDAGHDGDHTAEGRK